MKRRRRALLFVLISRASLRQHTTQPASLYNVAYVTASVKSSLSHITAKADTRIATSSTRSVNNQAPVMGHVHTAQSSPLSQSSVTMTQSRAHLCFFQEHPSHHFYCTRNRQHNQGPVCTHPSTTGAQRSGPLRPQRPLLEPANLRACLAGCAPLGAACPLELAASCVLGAAPCCPDGDAGAHVPLIMS